jgi:hypothetical protein
MADIPQSRTEEILYATINGEEYTGLPESRIEELLLELKEVIEEGGGGGGGTSTIAWKPTVAADGTISWVRTASETKPDDQNIKGPKGDTGETGAKGDTGETGSQGPKGDDGDPGLGIKLVSINQQGHLIITYDDDTTQDAGAIPGGGGAVDPPVINLEGIASENDVNTKSATFTAASTAAYLLIEVIAGDSFPVITSSSATVNGDNVNLKEYYADSAHINSKYAILNLKAGDVVAASVRSSIEAYGTSVSIMFVRLSSPIQNLVLKGSDARTYGDCSVEINADKDGFYLLFFFDRHNGVGTFKTIELNGKTITKNKIVCSSTGWQVSQGMCIASAKALDTFSVSHQANGYADAVGIFYVETGSDVISYSDLTDKPQINGVELNGNKNAADLGLVNAVSGKGLSANDFDNYYKSKLDNIQPSANRIYRNSYTLSVNSWIQTQVGVEYVINLDPLLDASFGAKVKLGTTTNNDYPSDDEIYAYNECIEGGYLFTDVIGDNPSSTLTIYATQIPYRKEDGTSIPLKIWVEGLVKEV